MKILIYGENEAALAVRDAERASGNSAFIRNPQYFNAVSFDVECQRVYADSDAIASAYGLRGIEVLPIVPPAPEPEPEPAEEEAEEEATPEPKRRGRPRKN